MKWQKKHDIILRWIDSCETFDQLMNLIPFVKRQNYDNSGLLFFIRIKASQLAAGRILENMEKLVRLV